MKTHQTITLDNAYKFNDNFTVQSDDGINFLGTEHNRQEADAIARWASSEHGRKFVAIPNSPDIVRRAQALSPRLVRFEYRKEALKEMGVW